VKPNFSIGAHHGGSDFSTSSAMATINRALSARAETNWAAITRWKPRGMLSLILMMVRTGSDKALTTA
jgi:hypothetical protein